MPQISEKRLYQKTSIVSKQAYNKSFVASQDPSSNRQVTGRQMAHTRNLRRAKNMSQTIDLDTNLDAPHNYQLLQDDHRTNSHSSKNCFNSGMRLQEHAITSLRDEIDQIRHQLHKVNNQMQASSKKNDSRQTRKR